MSKIVFSCHYVLVLYVLLPVKNAIGQLANANVFLDCACAVAHSR